MRCDFNKYINLDEKIQVIPANNFAVNELDFGDTLDQDYISLQFSKEANREYGKTYYVDTQNFFSQGKFDVKSSFASSPLTYLPGTGVSGSANQGTVLAIVGNLKVFYYVPDSYLCDNYAGPFDIYTSTGDITPGLIAYLDEYGNSKPLGYEQIADLDGTVYELNSLTAEIGADTGYVCV